MLFSQTEAKKVGGRVGVGLIHDGSAVMQQAQDQRFSTVSCRGGSWEVDARLFFPLLVYLLGNMRRGGWKPESVRAGAILEWHQSEETVGNPLI